MNWVDPYGLWSIRVDVYDGFGGGLHFGQNPNGSFFGGFRLGFGFGGGFSFDPKGKAPGSQKCPKKEDGLMNMDIGVFGEAGLEFRGGHIGISGNLGGHSQNYPSDIRPYSNFKPFDWGFGSDGSWGFRVGASAGGEVYFY